MMLRSLAWIAAALLSACVVGPDFKQPAAPDVKQYNEGKAVEEAGGQKLVRGGEVPADWWTMFGSKDLDSLVARALNGSLTVAAARARLTQAQENLSAQVGAVLFPNVDAKGSVSRQKITGASFGGTSRTYTLHNASVAASYGVDLFGASRRYLEGFESQIDYQKFQLQAARMTLAANIVTAAIKEASLREQIVATRQIIRDSEEQLAMIEQRFAIGSVAQTEVLAQRSTVAQNRTLLPGLNKQLQQNRNLLNVLAGLPPSDGNLPEFTLASLHLPHALPLSLPSELVRQRPDIMASEALLHQANADVGVATANMYPRITLTASYGSESRTFSKLFQGGTGVWDVAGGLVQPIFHAGELRHKKRAAVAAFDQAQANYREVVLGAFRDVADTLQALQSDAESVALQSEAENAARDTLDLVKQQYQAGAASYPQLLAASQQYQQARIGRTQAVATRFADSAALIVALGGGWWNEGKADMQTQHTAQSGTAGSANTQGANP